MNKSFNTKINFRRPLSQDEQFAFWRNMVGSIEKLEVCGNLQFNEQLVWGLDYSETKLQKNEAIKRFIIFLNRQKDIIKDFSLY